ncbi:MAG TPA: FAD-dependent oxidoreductase [Clostridiaceae bacterium]|nr:FAD-dependent oxidoreductase [Clostridiaceae bacterium]
MTTELEAVPNLKHKRYNKGIHYDYDVAIIGAGIVGTAIAYELSFFNLKTVLIERENDVAMGTTRANSAIIHAGYDPKPDTLMARLNVEGAARIPALCSRLDVPWKKTGSLVIGFDEGDHQVLSALYQRGLANKVPALRLLDREATLALEPELSKAVEASLWAPTAGVIIPWQLCLAFVETAVKGGCELLRNRELCSAHALPEGGFILQIRPTEQFFPDQIQNIRELRVRSVVNAAGVYADLVHNLVAPASFVIKPCRGEYYLLDRDTTTKVEHIIFQCPDERGKGIVVSQMVPGNILIGPNSQYIETRDDTSTTKDALAEVKAGALKSIPGLEFGDNIRSFSGIRANSSVDDFIIAEAVPGWIDAAGIRSPGLSAAPAIATMVTKLLQRTLGEEFKRRVWNPTRKRRRITEMSSAERLELTNTSPLYGRIICRCETVSEGEIVAALRGPVPALSMDGIKRRTDAGLGRCQSGFCGARVLEIISRELNVPKDKVILDRPNSTVLSGKMTAVNIGDNYPTASDLTERFIDTVPVVQESPSLSELAVTNSSQFACYDLIVIGGGPAGLAAALEAKDRGLARILLVERDTDLGGILNQCIHNGFGLHIFREELTGPEYAERFIEQLAKIDIELAMDTMVIDLGSDHQVQLIGKDTGWRQVYGKSIILAMGCRERTRGPLGISGTRPAGILTAGAAQRYVNVEGYMVGSKVIVLGSGDIGLIMARRMVLEGAQVVACVEIMPYAGGLTRNVVQCLNDFDIPLMLSSTITEIKGKERVESVVVMSVDDKRQPIPGTEQEFAVDTVLLSVGLIPENELSKAAGVELDKRTGGPIVFENMETSVPGIFACGNVVQVHGLVDFVTEEARRAGHAAADYVRRENKMKIDRHRFVENSQSPDNYVEIEAGSNLAYIVPQRARLDRVDTLICHFRVKSIFDDERRIVVKAGDRTVASFKRDYMVPGEMEQIKIPKALLAGIESNLVVDIS